MPPHTDFADFETSFVNFENCPRKVTSQITDFKPQLTEIRHRPTPLLVFHDERMSFARGAAPCGIIVFHFPSRSTPRDRR